jgi:hypothetical protein
MRARLQPLLLAALLSLGACKDNSINATPSGSGNSEAGASGGSAAAPGTSNSNAGNAGNTGASSGSAAATTPGTTNAGGGTPTAVGAQADTSGNAPVRPPDGKTNTTH